MFQLPQVSPRRAQVVIDEIVAGSDPHWRFYVLLIISAMVACLGLCANSTAVIIGAMLVSPLMTPIFGIALGMLQGAPRLVGKAFVAEAGGAFLAIASATLVGSFELTAGVATSEMLARTQPNLIDLLVAIFAGMAGSYALLDSRISPALPGVAIATAIVPPLSTCGLCIAMGAWAGAGGALLLFLANFVSILVVGLVSFAISGLAQPKHVKSWRGFVRHFGLTVAAFVFVTIVLTNSLVHIVRERTIRQNIEKALVRELADDHGVDLEAFSYNTISGRAQVLATVRSPRVLKPARVSQMEDSIRAKIGFPADLVVRMLRARDVTPAGSSLQVAHPDLDGSFLTQREKGIGATEALAEQVIRESFESEPGFELTNVEYGMATDDGGIVLAYVNAIRRFSTQELEDLEGELRRRLGDPELLLLLRVDSAQLEFTGGPVRAEWTSWRGATDTEIARFPEIEKVIRRTIAATCEVIPVHVHFNTLDGYKRVLVEVAGPQPVSPENAIMVEQLVSRELSTPIEIHLWYRNEFIVNSGGYTTYEELTDPGLEQRGQMLRDVFHSEVATAEEPNSSAAADEEVND